MLKYFLLTVFVVTLSSVENSFGIIQGSCLPNATASTGTHNFFAGSRNPYDRLLIRTEVTKPGQTRFFVGVKTIEEVPFKTATPITAVYVCDQFTNGTGGYVDQMKFGPGYYNVTLRFKSRKGAGYKFNIDIWGR